MTLSVPRKFYNDKKNIYIQISGNVWMTAVKILVITYLDKVNVRRNTKSPPLYNVKVKCDKLSYKQRIGDSACLMHIASP